MGHWVINDSEHSQDRDVSSRLKEKGFNFSAVERDQGNVEIYILTLTVNASEAVNNSTIICEYSLTGDGGQNPLVSESMTAALLVISSKLIAASGDVTVKQNNKLHTVLVVKAISPGLTSKK